MTVEEALAKRTAARAANIQAQAEAAKAYASVIDAQNAYRAYQVSSLQELGVLNAAIQTAIADQQVAYTKSGQTTADYSQTQLDVKQAMLDEDQQGAAGQENPGNTGPINTSGS